MDRKLDFPFDEVARAAYDLVKEGHTIYQKWSCTHCGERQAMAEPNKFFTQGQCEECSKITDLRIAGCNYLLIMNLGSDQDA